MDPNATLAEIRGLTEAILNANDEKEWARISEGGGMCRLAELTEALDEWITRGGFLPAGWSR